jgi:hypothetical protein
MPNLLPDWLPWIHPAGRLIWSLLLTGVGVAFVVALIRPPLPRKIIETRRAAVAIPVVIVLGLLLGKFASGIQTLVIWAMFGAVLAIAFAAVVSRNPRSPDQATTWAEAMVGAVGVFVLFTLAYGVVPHEWLTFANSYLNMSSDRFIEWPPWPFYDVVALPFSAIRDSVAALIYVVAIGANVVLWMRWQDRLAPAPEPTAAAEAPARTSRFGRPLKAKA